MDIQPAGNGESRPHISAPGPAERTFIGVGRGIWNAALLLLYPPRCRNCDTPLAGDDGIRICEKCWGQVETLSGDLCRRCGYPISDLNPVRRGYCTHCPTGLVHFDTARAAVSYDGPVKELIVSLKFRYQEHLASFLAEFLEPIFEEEFRGHVDFLVPVPLHWTRRRWREFNQSALLAEALARRKGSVVREDILRRARRTRPQSRTSGKGAKRRNVRGAFRVISPATVSDAKTLLIDDVYTSGNTVSECARVLKEAGARAVHVLTIARTLGGGGRS